MTDSIARPDLCVFIGRFQPEHVGHDAVIRAGLASAGHMLVLVGSAHEARSYYNPFTAEERAQMILGTFGHDPRLRVAALEDAHNSDRWVRWTRTTVLAEWARLREEQPDLPAVPQVALIGHSKDATTYYLELFPEWQSIEIACEQPLSATALRESLFGQPGLSAEDIDAFPRTEAGRQAYREAYAVHALGQAQVFLAAQRGAGQQGNALMSGPALDFLDRFLTTPAYRELCFEYAMVMYSKHQWRLAPYPPAFLTADAVVVQAGRVLMVRRKGYPGHGLWALPGGFVEENDRIEAAAWRELHEEAGLNVPVSVLRQHLVGKAVFDDPRRSSRGHTVTHAFFVELPGDMTLTVQAQEEEVSDLRWVDLATLQRDSCFEDHYGIIMNMTRTFDAREQAGG